MPYGSLGVPPVDDEVRSPEATVQEALRLLEQGQPFAAHEVYEARWKAAPDAERDLWQGLAQLAVARTHALRGNATGARRLLARGDERLRRYAAGGGPAYGIDLARMPQLAAAAVDAALGSRVDAGREPIS